MHAYINDFLQLKFHYSVVTMGINIHAYINDFLQLMFHYSAVTTGINMHATLLMLTVKFSLFSSYCAMTSYSESKVAGSIPIWWGSEMFGKSLAR